jgi:hypothetical protein
MGLFTWIKGLGRRGSNSPAPGNKAAREGEQVRVALSESVVQRGFGNGGPVTPKPPIKPQPTGGRLIRGDRDPGPVPPRLPDDLADLPVLAAKCLDGAAVAPAAAEMPSDELMKQWRDTAWDNYRRRGEPTWHTAALLAFAEGRRQSQALQIPPLGADPVATDEDLIVVATGPVWTHHSNRAIYEKGRADERTAILRALGVEP